MASDQIVELIELIKKDPARLQEFYSVVANSELVMPMILNSGQKTPIPILVRQYAKDAVVFDPVSNNYVPRRPGVEGDPYCPVYSNHDVYNSVKQILESRTQSYGQIVDPVVQNGRQIINMCCKKKRCAAINLFADGEPQYLFSIEQMMIIQRKPVVAKSD